jgi:parallel beta-helix repeat protein
MKKITAVALSAFLLAFLILMGFLVTRSNGPPNRGPPPPLPVSQAIHVNDGANLTETFQKNGTVYTLTRDVLNYTISVEKSSIVIDGAGHTLQGIAHTWHGGSTLNYGVDLAEHVTNVTIMNLNIAGFETAISGGLNSNITITGNNITQCTNNPAVYFWDSSNSNITGNQITANANGGIEFNGGSGNTISDNLIVNNQAFGVQLSYSSGTILRNNHLENNTLNIAGITGNEDIDDSNTVQGKPVYYWRHTANKTVPANAGLVVLYSCRNITVENLTLTNNDVAIVLFYTEDAVIAQNNLSRNGFGITALFSSNNNIAGNEVSNNILGGIKLTNSSNYQITHNNVANNAGHGVIAHDSHRNTVANNTFTSNVWFGVEFHNGKGNVVSENGFFGNGAGIADGGGGVDLIGGADNLVVGNLFKENDGFGTRVSASPNSTFYHNDFINNQVTGGLQVSNPWMHDAESNTWDNGAEGNYWSDYWTRYPNASEIGNSGQGDTPFLINPLNIDHHPLVKPITANESAAPNLTPAATVSASSTLIPSPEPITALGLDYTIALAALLVVSAAVVAAVILRKRQRSPKTSN